MSEKEVFCRFRQQGTIGWGLVINKDDLQLIKGSPFEGFERTDTRVPLSDIKGLPPTDPSKIVAIGLNYRDHAEEVKLSLPEEPLIFLKPSTAVIGPGDPIVIPPTSQRVDYEGELAVIIGKKAKNVVAAAAGDYIAGFTCLNDVTARDLQRKDKQWTRGKSFDTFAPMGPFLVRGIDVSDLALKTELNGKVVQTTATSQLIFPPAQLVSFISGVMTLLPGDVITTGTTSGIGPMKPGDVVTVTIEDIGSLSNPVVRA